MTTGILMVFEGPGLPLRTQTRSLPALQPGEVLVKNVYTTLCGSDLHTVSGLRQEKTPTVLGHEIVGKIVSLHNAHSQTDYQGNPLQEGDVITWTVFAADPASVLARNGMPQKSEPLFKYGHTQLTETDAFHGGLADYCILKVNTTILKVPETIPLPIAATINCAIATVAGAVRLAGNLVGKSVLITGMGMLGIVCAAMCKEAGASVIWASDLHESRLQQSLAFGVDEARILENNLAGALRQAVRSSLGTPGFDVVFDMSGAPDAVETGLEALAIGGTAIWIGAVFKSRNIQVDAEQIVRRLLTIKGLHNYNCDDFLYALHFINRAYDKYPFLTLIGKEFPLNQAQQAFDYALQQRPLRVGIRIGD